MKNFKDGWHDDFFGEVEGNNKKLIKQVYSDLVWSYLDDEWLKTGMTQETLSQVQRGEDVETVGKKCTSIISVCYKKNEPVCNTAGMIADYLKSQGITL